MSTTDPKEVDELTAITADIDRTRTGMQSTINALEHRLSPAELADQAKVQLDHLEGRVKALVKEELHEAKDLVTQGLSDARRAVKEDITTAIANTKKSIREATIGRIENIATQAGDVMNDTKDTLIDTIRQNPIPAALAGIGVVWLFMNRSTANRRRSAGYDTGRSFGGFEASGGSLGRVAEGATGLIHGVEHAMGNAGSAVAGAARDASTAVRGAVGHGVDAVSHLVDGATAATGRLAHDAADITGRAVHGVVDAAGHFATNAQGAMASAAHIARDQAVRIERGLASTLESNPLAMGAVALAAGAAVGYALPRTRREDALLGGMRDQVLQGATALAHDAAKSLHHLTDQAGDNVRKALSAPGE